MVRNAEYLESSFEGNGLRILLAVMFKTWTQHT